METDIIVILIFRKAGVPMQWGIDALIIINGKDRSDSVVSCNYRSGRCDIIYNNSPKVYSYFNTNVKILKLIQQIDPKSVVFKAGDRVVTDIDQILYFGEYYRVLRSNRKALSFRAADVEIQKNCLYEARSRELFSYFKATAKAISLKTDNGLNILEQQYDRIQAVEELTVLSKYLDPGKPIEVQNNVTSLIYPFGLNQSQKAAIQNAFASQVSIIQGPPGTGKTQTILNIIANAVRRGNTVAVVSNNNSATQNVAEKLEKHGLSFLTAFLGSKHNKERFIDAQTGLYPPISSWMLSKEQYDLLTAEVEKLSDELNTMLNSRNRIAQVEQELLAIKPEHFYFGEYYNARVKTHIDLTQLEKLPSGKLLSLWLEYENNADKKVGFFRKIVIAIKFSKAALKIFRHVPDEAIPFLQKLYYDNKIQELQSEKEMLESQLRDYHFSAKMEELRKKSMVLFKSELARRYNGHAQRRIFDYSDFRKNSADFVQEYPVILSTTYSIKGTLSMDYVYDYLIVDEASQVDLATGVLAFSCAKNIIIVGDQKQLPNVLTQDDIRIADAIWNRHTFDERYHFATHSMLASAAEIWHNAPSVLLREHYRCHPKIAAFFNQKFYNGELIVMTEDHDEKDVLTMYRTPPGNHARGHLNQRQLDIIREEILPKLANQGYTDIGVITPYREQVAATAKQLGHSYDVATVHKFQGREKDAIVLASVDNIIGDFVDDPNMLNVAVSRAVKSLSVVISNSKENENTNYGDLAKYIEYNNFQIVDSKVFSVFDMLYKDYCGQRWQYLRKHKRISEFDSENLAYSVIEKILATDEFSKIGCVIHSSLATLVRDQTMLTEREAEFAFNPLTHLDFLLFNKMDKSPVVVIEIDGTRFHAQGSRQAERDAVKDSVLLKCGIPVLRLRTNESDEEERIVAMLREALR